MTLRRATKVRIYPTDEQAAFLNAQFGAVRFAYNKALHIQRHMFKRHGISLKPKRDLKPILNAKGDSLRRRWEGNFAGASAPLVLNVLLDHL
ncbi:helix-turn-helix domain-containing protein [Aeromonas caviae]|uniref:helix-turn-helix domain-containing protein n=2 Tax=Aeromonas caviae TaxID=648 RepID=UPI003521E774